MAPLRPPNTTPPVIDGVLCRSNIDDSLIITVPPYSNISIGDQLILYVNGLYNNSYIIQTLPFYGWFPGILKNSIRSGVNNIFYTITDIAGNTSVSEKLIFFVEDVCGELLPAPGFIFSLNGSLLTSVVNEHNGTIIRVGYQNMKIGDAVLVKVSGLDVNGDNIANADANIDIRVASHNVTNGFVDVQIPRDNIISVGINGAISAHYTVNENKSSTPSSVILVRRDVVASMSFDEKKKKVDDPILLTINVVDPTDGSPVPNAKIKFSTSNKSNRKGCVVSDAGDIYFDGLLENNYTGVTSNNGELECKVTNPNGIGVETMITAFYDDMEISNDYVIFTVITSPDSQFAQMWGHMPDSLKLNDLNLSRPALRGESTDSVTYKEEDNEFWQTFRLSEASQHCNIPDIQTLTDLFISYGSVKKSLGWPVLNKYRSSTSTTPGYHQNINLDNGDINIFGGDEVSSLYLTCIKNTE